MIMKSERDKSDLAKEQGGVSPEKNIVGDECPTGGRAEGADRPLQKKQERSEFIL
jgi:hypothetical protein